MIQNNTKKKKTQNENSLLQEKCIDLLLLGKNITEISNVLNVTRNTIYLWKRDSVFQSNLNIRKNEIREKMECDLFRLTDLAIETLQNCLNSKNELVKFKTAMFLLSKQSSLIIRSENPNVIDREKMFSEF